MAQLTSSELNAYIGESNYILYLRDRALLNYTFAKLGKEGWKSLVDPIDEEPDPNMAPARAEFLAEYDLPEFRRPGMTAKARTDLGHALKVERIPNWVLNLLRAGELKQLIQKAGKESG